MKTTQETIAQFRNRLERVSHFLTRLENASLADGHDSATAWDYFIETRDRLAGLAEIEIPNFIEAIESAFPQEEPE